MSAKTNSAWCYAYYIVVVSTILGAYIRLAIKFIISPLRQLLSYRYAKLHFSLPQDTFLLSHPAQRIVTSQFMKPLHSDPSCWVPASCLSLFISLAHIVVHHIIFCPFGKDQLVAYIYIPLAGIIPADVLWPSSSSWAACLPTTKYSGPFGKDFFTYLLLHKTIFFHHSPHHGCPPPLFPSIAAFHVHSPCVVCKNTYMCCWELPYSSESTTTGTWLCCGSSCSLAPSHPWIVSLHW